MRAAAPAQDIVVDRRTGRVEGASLRERAVLDLLRLGARVSGLWGHTGLSLLCRAVAPVLEPSRFVVLAFAPDARFRFPFADRYWSMLFDTARPYEPELYSLLKGIADDDYDMVDCGANFGLWPVLVSSSAFGAHRVVAVEPSSRNFAHLATNARLNGGRFQTLQVAIGSEPGRARLAGAKHEALSIAAPAGAAEEEGEEVEVIPLDALIDRGLVDPSRRLLLKLDVEGVETAAVRGAPRLLESDILVVYEEHGGDRAHTVSRFMQEHTPFRLYWFDEAVSRFMALDRIDQLDSLKTNRRVGYNVFATRSAFWEERLKRFAPPATETLQ